MKNLVSEIRSIIETSRSNAVRSVDFCRVQMYWQIGRRIVEEEQGGQARAEYGKGLIKNLAQEIEPEYGSGFSYKLPEENPTIGILLCTAKNDTLVKMTLPSDNNTIVASKYQLYLPTEQQLIEEVERVKKEWEETR